MNRVLLIINAVVLVLLLAVGTPLAFQVLSLRGQMQTLQSEHDKLTEHEREHRQRMGSTQQRIDKLDQRLASKPEQKEVQQWLDDQRKALQSTVKSIEEEGSTARARLEQAIAQLETSTQAAEQARLDLKNELAAVRRQVSGEIVDITGEWTLHNEPTPNELPVTISRVEDDRFRLASGHNAHGIYQLDEGQLEMVKSGSKEYTGFVWKVISADKLKLLTTQYAGSTLVRKGAGQ